MRGVNIAEQEAIVQFLLRLHADICQMETALQLKLDDGFLFGDVYTPHKRSALRGLVVARNSL